MSVDLNQDLAKRFLNFLDTKQYKRLQFEADMIGEIENQHPLIIFYYASAIYLQDSSTNEELIYASSLFEKVYLLKKTAIQPLQNMIVISFKTKQYKKVLNYALEAYETNKQNVILIEGLARMNFYLGNRKESLKLFKSLYEILPEKTEGRFPFISSLNYASGISQEEYMEECLKYTKIIEKKLNIDNDKFEFIPNKNKKIKINFLSADFKKHSVSYFLKDLLNRLDKSIFEISLVSNLKVTQQDELSVELKNIVDNWYDVEDLSTNELTKFLISLNIDILIDLSGFTRGNRFEVLAKRCAKIQILWLGYNNSLGIKNLDYLISDKNLIKPNEFNLYKEKVLYLPKIWNSLSIPENLPEIDKESKLNNSLFTFCSFNNFQKLSDQTIGVWSQILKNKKSNLLLKDSLRGGPDLKNNVIEKFRNNGVGEEQIIFLDHQESLSDHLRLYNKANAALDTFPYPGVTTSCEAILMGLPVLTMKGFNFNSRCGESINKTIDMEHMIANDEKDYLEKAFLLMEDSDLVNKYGINLRKKALSSALFDTETFAKDFQNLILKVNKDYI